MLFQRSWSGKKIDSIEKSQIKVLQKSGEEIASKIASLRNKRKKSELIEFISDLKSIDNGRPLKVLISLLNT